MITIVLLGSGKVASHLYDAFHDNSTTNVVQVYNRSQKNLERFKSVNTTTSISKLIDADVYVIAVADDGINELSKKLQLRNKLVVHTSGSIPMEAISQQHNRGVFYPLQTFSESKAVDFKTVPLCIEAEHEHDLKLLNQLAKSVSNAVYHISSSQRKAIHIAAVFVNNFVNHLYQKGEEICAEHQVPFDILKPLIQETSEKIMSLSPKESQTGPAIRNDHSVIQQHLSDLNTTTQQEIYKLLTKSIQQTYDNKL
ncbi:MAG: Rossmann-like and DUF2520 domain-containing protein [Flavobacteriaceae bacterium]